MSKHFIQPGDEIFYLKPGSPEISVPLFSVADNGDVILAPNSSNLGHLRLGGVPSSSPGSGGGISVNLGTGEVILPGLKITASGVAKFENIADDKLTVHDAAGNAYTVDLTPVT